MSDWQLPPPYHSLLSPALSPHPPPYSPLRSLRMASPDPSFSSSSPPWFCLLSPLRALCSLRGVSNPGSPRTESLSPPTPDSHTPTDSEADSSSSTLFLSGFSAQSDPTRPHCGRVVPASNQDSTSWSPLPTFELFQEVPRSTVKTFLREWGESDLLTSPPESSEGLELVGMTHGKNYWKEYQHEYLILRVLNTRSRITLYLVAERDIDKSRAISKTVGRAKDTLCILSKEDLKDFKNIMTISRVTWNRARPPLHEVIALLCLTSQLHPDYSALGSNCYLFAAVARVAIEEYHTTYQPQREIALSKASKGSTLCRLQITSPQAIYKDALQVVILFHERYSKIVQGRDFRGKDLACGF